MNVSSQSRSSSESLATRLSGKEKYMTYRRLPDNLPAILRRAGLTVVEVEGWQTRGRPAHIGDFDPHGVLCHHTATGPKTSDAAVVNLLVNGRSDLPGPLVQLGLNRKGVVYIIASGRANHAGKARASGNMPAGDGNTLYVGIEGFNDGVGEDWSPEQMEAYKILCAVLSKEVTKNTAQSVRGHKETSTTGKPDPLFDMNIFRKGVANKMNAPQTKMHTTFRVASENLMSLPKNQYISKTLKALNTIPVVGFQEASEPSFKKALLRRYPAIIGLGPIDNNTYAAPVVANANRFRHIKTGTRLIHKGRAHVSLTRRLTWAIVEEKRTKIRFGIINLHAVVVKKDAHFEARKAMRQLDKEALKAQVAEFQKQGLPVLVIGDFNDRANWLGSTFGGHRVQRVQHKVDQILFVDGVKFAWSILRWNHVDTPSDHDAVRAQVSLSEK